MPTVQIYHDIYETVYDDRTRSRILRLLDEHLRQILAETLSTRAKNVILLPRREMIRREKPAIFIDVLIKDRPERSENLAHRHWETCKRIIDLIHADGLHPDLDNIGLRIALAPLEYSTLQEAVSK